MANAQVSQSAVNLVLNASPNAVVSQSVVQVVLFGGSAPTVSLPAQIVPGGGGCAAEGCGPVRPPQATVTVPRKMRVDRRYLQNVFYRHGRS